MLITWGYRGREAEGDPMLTVTLGVPAPMAGIHSSAWHLLTSGQEPRGGVWTRFSVLYPRRATSGSHSANSQSSVAAGSPITEQQPCVLRSQPQEDSHRTLSPALAFGAGLQELGAELLRLCRTLRHQGPGNKQTLTQRSGKSGGEIKLGKK